MFVKIIYNKVRIKDLNVQQPEQMREAIFVAEHLYDCVHCARFPSREPEQLDEDVKEWNIVMDLKNNKELTISIPVREDQRTEVFVMNDLGKTVDHYEY